MLQQRAGLDVGEAANELRKSKTVVVQCAGGELCFLRNINERDAVGEPITGGGVRTWRGERCARCLHASAQIDLALISS